MGSFGNLSLTKADTIFSYFTEFICGSFGIVP